MKRIAGTRQGPCCGKTQGKVGRDSAKAWLAEMQLPEQCERHSEGWGCRKQPQPQAAMRRGFCSTSCASPQLCSWAPEAQEHACNYGVGTAEMWTCICFSLCLLTVAWSPARPSCQQQAHTCTTRPGAFGPPQFVLLTMTQARLDVPTP